MPFKTIIPANPNPRFAGVFHWWLRRMMRRQWHAVRLAPGGVEILRRIAAEREPAIAVMNHCSWWDPLVGLWMADRFTPSRQLIGPMEAEQLRKFRFFTKLGVFGLEPDSPESLDEVTTYLRSVFAADQGTILWITPQGQFTDPRVPIRIRPGVASIAARCGVRRCFSMAIEYGFWNDKRPEIFLRLAEVEVPPAASTTGWIRAIAPAMQANSDELAALVQRRESALFETLLGGDTARINPLYDLWLRLRGKSAALSAKDRGMAQPAPARPTQASSASGGAAA
jgi:1-acyl-sn-glycerol-3-phosphate acyltransferase